MDVSRDLPFLGEVSPCCFLTIRVIRARNLRKADLLSHPDCYSKLQLPTASPAQFQTKTIHNCKDPIWNETFHFIVQPKVKNVLELNVHDDDDVCQDDHLFTVRFDIARLPLNEKVLMHFNCNQKEHEELELEFELLHRSRMSEIIITNGVLLSRQVSCLEVEVEKKKAQNSKKKLYLIAKGSHEEHKEFSLGFDFCMKSTFHYIKYKHLTLDIRLPKKDLDYLFEPCSYNKEEKSLKVEVNAIPQTKKIVLAENKKFALHVKTEDCKTNPDLRLGYDLCSQEQDFLHKRKNIVTAALKKVLRLEKDLQDHEVSAHAVIRIATCGQALTKYLKGNRELLACLFFEVPVVAIMTTGGSMRSLTACFGSLRGLQKLNLLDCATYLSGLSGTTWTMAKLYKDAYWSRKNLDEQIYEAKRHVTKSKLNILSMERLEYYKRQLRHRKEEGQKTSCIDLWGLLIEYMLNDEKDNHKLSDQQKAVNEGQNPFPIYTAINVKEKYSTMDFKEWLEFTPYEVGILKYGAFVRTEDFGSEFFMGHLMKKLPETQICYLQDEEPHLTIEPHEQKTDLYIPAGPLSSAFRDVLTDRLSVAQYHNFIKGLQLDNKYLENESFSRWQDTILDSSPNQLTQTEKYLSLEDTGFFINTSSAPLLKPERKVDVILHLNYSAGSQSLQSCKYYADQGIPFPKAVLKDDDKHLKECYLFEDAENPAAPILLFFPQVNDTFRYYKAPGVKRSESEMKYGNIDISSNSTPYSTYSMTFTEEEYDQLIELSEYNILNNQHLILQALDRAVERKKNP
ncbi:Phospholipase A2 [Crotalus adamanteus]|uniref:Phospholipase A2 n=1 Tax=Crotalus adamanteus TaxID=8729 RepID=A0AAW1C602_CROAD